MNDYPPEFDAPDGCEICPEDAKDCPHQPSVEEADPSCFEEETPQEKAGMVRCWGCSEWSWTVYCDKCAKAGKANCVHGKEPGECDACDHQADLAFDAAREG